MWSKQFCFSCNNPKMNKFRYGNNIYKITFFHESLRKNIGQLEIIALNKLGDFKVNR